MTIAMNRLSIIAVAVLNIGTHADEGTCKADGKCQMSSDWNEAVYGPRAYVKPTFPPEPLSMSGKDQLAGKTIKDVAATKQWFIDSFPDLPDKQTDLSDIEKTYVKWTYTDFVAHRKKGSVTCLQYATALVKRAIHLKEMRVMTSWEQDPKWTDKVLQQATSLDEKAKKSGVESLAPLYCVPIMIKGTVATKDFISHAGSGVLANLYAIEDAKIIQVFKEKNGIIFGKTTVPDFAASGTGCTYHDGCPMNPRHKHFSSGGSSGGSGCAVAAFIAPCAVTEDTAGSTRIPAAQNGNFGWDPTRGKFPNDGNPGMSYFMDQVGFNCRSFEDFLFIDNALHDLTKEYAAASTSAPKIAAPKHPFQYGYACKGCKNFFGLQAYPESLAPSTHMAEGLKRAKKVLSAEDIEFPQAGGGLNSYQLAFQKMAPPSGNPMDFTMIGISTWAAQAGAWIRSHLDSPIGTKAVFDDAYTTGAGHGPAAFELSRLTSELDLMWLIGEGREKACALYNRIFDEHDVDLILVPSILSYKTYPCLVDNTCPIGYVANMEKNQTAVDKNIGGMLSAIFFSTFIHKAIPIPKMTFPVGVDPVTKQPYSAQFLGRCGPKDATSFTWAYNETYLATMDVQFMTHVGMAVKKLADAGYGFVAPDMVARDLDM